MFVRLSIFSLLAWSSVLFAQPEITRSHFWQVGDRFTRVALDVSAVTPGNAGANQVWDFSARTSLLEPTQTIEMISASAAPHIDAFPGTTAVELSVTNGVARYHYWSLDDERMRYLGGELNGTLVTYSESANVLEWPLRFESTSTDTFESGMVVQGLEISRNGSFNVEVDGYGTLRLSNGSYENVLRVKSTQTMTQTGPLPALAKTISTTSYSWHSADHGYPLLTWLETVSESSGKRTTESHAWYLDVTQEVATADRYTAHLAAFGGNFVSDVLIYNSGAEESVNLLPFEGDGDPLTPSHHTLATNQLLSLSHESVGTSTSHLGISGCESCTVSIGYRAASGGGTAQIHQTEPATEFLIYPGEWDTVFDGMAVVNLGSGPAQIVGHVLASDRTVIAEHNFGEVVRNGKLLSNFLVDFQGKSGHAIRIKATEPVVLLMLRGSLDGRFLYQSRPLEPSGSNSRWLPHLANFGGSFVSEVYVYNSGNSSDTLNLTPMTQGGESGTTIPISLDAGAFSTLSHEAVGQNTSHLRLDGCSDCVASIRYRAASGGGSAQVHQSLPGMSFTVYRGAWDVLWDGLAVVNSSPQPANINAHMLDESGNILETVPIATNLASNAKALANVASFFTQQGAMIRISADRNIAVLMLRGSLDGKYLYENVPID